MIDLFKSIKSLTKLSTICIDNQIFRLHYKATVILLIASSIMVTAKQFFGEPIICITEKIPQKVMDTYCWIQSTFTVPDSFDREVGREVAHPGVSTYVKGRDAVKYHSYYQWVCIVLFFQAICFYVPHYIWKVCESNRIRNLVSNLNNTMLDNTKRSTQIKILSEYLIENLNMHNWYAFRFFMCEILNFVNVVAQIFLVDEFLDNEFSNYGIQVLTFTELDQEHRTDPMTKIFPKVTKCEFHKYGASGTIETHDSLCILPLNIINEKIYIFMWFWFIILAVISGMSLIYRFIICAFPQIRLQILRIRNRVVSFHSLYYIVDNVGIGDWFVLLQLTKNIDQLTSKALIENLEKEIMKKNNPKAYQISVDVENGS